MPTPPMLGRALPVIGHLPYLYGLGVDSFAFFMEGYRRHGRVFAIKERGKKLAVLLGPEAHRFILERETPTLSWGAAYSEGGRRVFGETALPLVDGEAHRTRRTPMMPAFRPHSLAAFTDTMVTLTRAQSESWAARPQVELVSELSELTFRIACGFLLGVDIGEDYPQFREAYLKMFSMRSLLLQGLGLAKQEGPRRTLERLASRWIAERREKPRDDIISRLLEAGLSEEDVLAQVLILMFAGHDTTKLSLTWTLTLLLQHPEYLERVLAEQEEVVGEGPLTAEAAKRMPVLERALREANRLYPPAAMLRRGVLEDCEFGGYTIPKGWMVAYLPRVAHQLPDVFAEPERFEPDRFAPPRDEHKQPYALVDFGAGHRTCIGKEMSLFEGKVVLSHLLRTLRFELVPGQRFEPVGGALTVPKYGVRVVVKPRLTEERKVA